MQTTHDIHSKRPTSPHLTIYKPQISSTLSIFHRMTGVANFFALNIFVWWFIAKLTTGFAPCSAECSIMKDFEIFLKPVLILISYSFIYHSCTGLRHLFWDLGKGMDVKTVNLTGWSVIVLSFILTTILWGVIL